MSFAWSVYFREGSWYEFRNFALNQRKNIEPRLKVINNELSQIGYIRVTYEKDSATSKMTEKRVGFEINKGSSLHKLIIAYVVQGGNPFDISMFLKPDSYAYVDGIIVEKQPYTGIIAPLPDKNPQAGSLSTGGWLPLWKFPPRKFGKNLNMYDFGKEISDAVESAKRWIPQEIKELRNDLEARIIKLCDLREQLLKERDEILLGAVSGVTPSLLFDSESYSESHHLSFIVNNIDNIVYPNLDSSMSRDFNNPRISTQQSAYPTLVDNAPNDEEKWTAL